MQPSVVLVVYFDCLICDVESEVEWLKIEWANTNLPKRVEPKVNIALGKVLPS